MNSRFKKLLAKKHGLIFFNNRRIAASNKNIKAFLLTALMLIAHVILYAQPKANFVSSAKAGCIPFLVQFIDSSTGSPAEWHWNLGTGSSTQQNPSIVYYNPGTYTVTLVVKNSTGIDSITQKSYIQVYGTPIVNFTKNVSTGCAPLKVQFNDVSYPGSGVITKWNWSFGDGSSSITQSPQHIFASPGLYNVTLNAVNQFGCSQSLTTVSAIKTDSIIKADFSYAYSNVCKSPVTIDFHNLSTGALPSAYQWSFGDGGASSQSNPSYTYNTNGHFKVMLIAGGPTGCIDTVIKQISTGAVTAGFSMAVGGCVNNNYLFSDSSLPAAKSITWYFGDGATSTQPSIMHSYTAPGHYNVKMVANFGSCTDSITKVFTVTPKPTISFLAGGDTASCKVPATVSFNNKSSGATSYLWDFGDSATSTSVNPSHIYTKPGFFTVFLKALNGIGCSDTLANTGQIKLGAPHIDSIENLPFTGCAPGAVVMQASVSAAVGQITNYTWNFGDGQASNQKSAGHTYANAGNYDVTLIVSSAPGCADTLMALSGVMLGNKPKAAFSANTRTACAISTGVVFTDLSTGSITSWLWAFGALGNSAYQNPGYRFTQLGNVDVILTVSSNGCTDTDSGQAYMLVKPPLTYFKVIYDCKNSMQRSFVNYSAGAATTLWDFGDGVTSTDISPTHLFLTPGRYPVKLTSYNDTCSNLLVDTIMVYSNNISYKYNSPSTSLCKNDTVQFAAVNFDTTYFTGFNWFFGDSTSTGFGKSSSISHKYLKVGAYIPQLIVKAVDGCIDTVNQSTAKFNVYGPTALFSNHTTGCQPVPVLFTNLSVADSLHTIKQWYWDFGDGLTKTYNTPTTALHAYTMPGKYNIMLKVTDAAGCIDSVYKPNDLYITNPIASFAVADTTRCLNAQVFFNDSSSGIALQYEWYFGDGQTSSLALPQHIYPNKGIYSVALKITDSTGCVDSLIKNNLLHIQNPQASFTLTDTVANCPPLVIEPINTSAGSQSVVWNFGDGTSSDSFNVKHYYYLPGTYRLTLTATGYGNCFDSSYKTVVVQAANASIEYNPLNGCDTLNVHFNVVNASKVSTYTWGFGNNATITTQAAAIDYSYNTAGQYLPQVTLTDSTGCTITLVDSSKKITVAHATAKFIFAGSNGCDSSLFNFIDSSTIYFDKPSAFLWNFGDSTISLLTNPMHYYNATGTYTVMLQLKSLNNCSSSFSLPVKVLVDIAPVIKANVPSTLCVNQNQNFNAAAPGWSGGNLNWFWNFGNNQTSTQQNTNFKYSKAAAFDVVVTATTDAGCTDSAQQLLTVQALPVISAGPDTTLCVNQPVALYAQGATNYAWRADTTLSCTNCSSPLAAPSATTTYYVTGTNQQGCTAVDSVIILVAQPQKMVVTANNSLCYGSSLQLYASGAHVYYWQPSTGLSSTDIADPITSTESTITYTVTGRDKNNCYTDTALVTVQVYSAPYFTIADSIETINAGSSITLNTSISANDSITWLWKPNIGLSCTSCSTTTASPLQSTKYSFTATSKQGCSATKFVTINVLCTDKSLYIPTAFTPNGDGANDVFYPRSNQAIPINSLIIFNRWGQIVFERKNFTSNSAPNGWNGIFNNNPQPAGTYVYMLEAYCQTGKLIKLSGTITLLR